MPRAKLRTEALRATVVEKALELLESEGLPVLTTRRVAALSGTSPPAIYEFFKDKKGLVAAVFFEGFRMLADVLEAQSITDDSLADLEAVVWAFRRFASKHPALTELMFSKPFSAFEPSSEQIKAGEAVRRALVSRAARCVDEGALHGDPHDIAHNLLALMMGLSTQERGGWLGSSPDAATGRWRLGVEALFRGFSEPPVAPQADIDIQRATTNRMDVAEAVSELREQLGEAPTAVIVFASPRYDLDAFGPAVQRAFPRTTVVGCTTSGQIGAAGYQPDGIAATSMGGPFAVCSFAIDLKQVDKSVRDLTPGARAHLEAKADGERSFGFLLVDGLSEMEEELGAALKGALGGVPIVGGSAGDDLGFVETRVLVDGEFRSSTAVLLLVRTSAPFAPIKVVHHIPTDRRVVVTAADPTRRMVLELDHRPAAAVYAELVGSRVEDLGLSVFTRHPFIETIEGEGFIRSVQRIEEDGSIRFHCSIEPGVELAFAESAEVMESLRSAFDEVKAVVKEPKVILGCDCVMRRLQLEELGMDQEVGEFFAKQAVIGFSTYGEQVDGQHANQTFAGIALGSKAEA